MARMDGSKLMVSNAAIRKELQNRLHASNKLKKTAALKMRLPKPRRTLRLFFAHNHGCSVVEDETEHKTGVANCTESTTRVDNVNERTAEHARLRGLSSWTATIGVFGLFIIHLDNQVQRRPRDPRVALSSILEGVWAHLRALPAATHFSAPVNARDVPDYQNIISVSVCRGSVCLCLLVMQMPMDLRTIKTNISNGVYVTREAFIGDVKLILDNSRLVLFE